jgi:hypothetical protein
MYVIILKEKGTHAEVLNSVTFKNLINKALKPPEAQKNTRMRMSSSLSLLSFLHGSETWTRKVRQNQNLSY